MNITVSLSQAIALRDAGWKQEGNSHYYIRKGVDSFDLYSADSLEVKTYIKEFGLSRSEAFQIIDTEGRGRTEIDDRIRWFDRLEAMSSGVSPL